jgi:hypothetical protein
LLPVQDYPKYKAWFDGEHSALVLPNDSSEITAPTVGLAHSLSTTWTLKWILKFGDGKYLRVQEHYNKVTGLIGLSRRQAFAFHYGPIGAVTPDGIPDRKSNDPVDLRIDNSGAPAHMHLRAPQPHIGQERVDGLEMEDLDIFTFVRGIFSHRKTGNSFEKIFKFRIK